MTAGPVALCNVSVAVYRTTIDKYERNTVLTVRKCERPDSGKYKLVLSNSSGTCEGICDVIVLGESPVRLACP